MEALLFFALSFAFLWLLLIRPQQQRVRRHRQMLSTLEVGDEVVTAGGILGTIIELKGDRASLEIAPGVVIGVLRPAISRRVDGDVGDVGEGGASAAPPPDEDLP